MISKRRVAYPPLLICFIYTELIMLHFDSDYMRGCCPEVLSRIAEVNGLQLSSYGTDVHTLRAGELILHACGLDHGAVYFLVGGTQTNATVIDGLLRQWQGVLCGEDAHINVHEAGAIEASGHKVIVLPGNDGKISAEEVENYLASFYGDDTWPHMVEPGMVYITFPTELGTLYTLPELEALSAVCRRHRIPLYLDGARLLYGLAASPDVTLADIARLCDVFYIGGTKAGTLFGEAVVIPKPEILPHFFTLVKRHGALLAKGQFAGVQFEALFEGDLWKRVGRNGIDTAMRLREGMLARGYRLYIDSPTNQQFFVLPNGLIDRLQEHVSFGLWGPRREAETPVRFVTDFATPAADIDALLAFIDSLREEGSVH